MPRPSLPPLLAMTPASTPDATPPAILAAPSPLELHSPDMGSAFCTAVQNVIGPVDDVDKDGALDTSVPRPLGPRRRTVPSVAYPKRPRASLPRSQDSSAHVAEPVALATSPTHEPALVDAPLVMQQPSGTSLPRPACSICGEVPPAYCLLTNCNHVFCVSCLRQWRQQGTTCDQDELTSNFKCCPMCRTRSLLCVRAPDFVTGDAKKAHIDQALASKKQVPCRFFAKSLRSSRGPFCPFGDECFYMHKMGQGQFRFGMGAEAIQAKSSARRRVAENRSYPPSEDEGSDTESVSSYTSNPPARTALRRSGSIGRARTRFGGSGLGLTPMAPQMTPMSSSGSSRGSPIPDQPPSRRSASFGALSTGLAPLSPTAASTGSTQLERRGSLAAAAAAARRQREARAASMSASGTSVPGMSSGLGQGLAFRRGSLSAAAAAAIAAGTHPGAQKDPRALVRSMKPNAPLSSAIDSDSESICAPSPVPATHMA